LIALAASCWLAPTHAFCAQDIDEAKAGKVKAAYLFNFAKFIQWPDKTFKNQESPFVIGVICSDSFAQTLDKIVRGKKIADHPVRVRRIHPNSLEAPSAINDCQMVYICRSQGDRVSWNLTMSIRRSVLLVSDIKGFASKGGMIGLALENGRIVFEINRENLKRAGLKASAKLLALARIVKSKERRP